MEAVGEGTARGNPCAAIAGAAGTEVAAVPVDFGTAVGLHAAGAGY